MVAQNRSSGTVRQSLESVASTTDKWWYLPAIAGASAALLTLAVYFTAAPEWALETVVVLVVLPATILAVPAIAFDILNKYDDDVVPPGVFLYPGAVLMALFVGTAPLVAVIVLYLATRVLFGPSDDE